MGGGEEIGQEEENVSQKIVLQKDCHILNIWNVWRGSVGHGQEVLRRKSLALAGQRRDLPRYKLCSLGGKLKCQYRNQKSE